MEELNSNPEIFKEHAQDSCTYYLLPLHFGNIIQISIFNFPTFIDTKKQRETSAQLNKNPIQSKSPSEKKESFKCPSQGCDRVYMYKTSLNRHLQYECQVPPKFKCQFCPHRTSIHCNMLKHIKKCTGGKPNKIIQFQ